jgi:hypothetical protein
MRRVAIPIVPNPARSSAMTAARAMLLAAAALAPLAAPSAAWAQEGYTAREDCAKKGVDIAECLEFKLTRSEDDLADMESRYQAALDAWEVDPQVRDEAKSAFASAMDEFRRYRQKQCDFVALQAGAATGASPAAGSAPGGPSVELRRACQIELNALRIDELDVALRKFP